MLKNLSRRAALAMAGAGALLAGPARAASPTPRQTPGPFYPGPEERVADTDWDLVRVAGRVRAAGGEVMWLSGKVLDTGGAPITGARVEIWQCDVNGRYHHSADTGAGRPRDDDFQGFGAARTGPDGDYRFRTIRPVVYPGRTPHIHARIVPPEARELVTQIYVLDDPQNQRDFIFRSLGAAKQAMVVMDPARRPDGDLQASFNFVV